MTDFIGETFPEYWIWSKYENQCIDSIRTQIDGKFDGRRNLLVNLTWFGPQFDYPGNAYDQFLKHTDSVDNLFILSTVDPCMLQQAQIESRVIYINDTIARANVIDVTKIENNGNVIFGSTVTVLDLESEKKTVYKLVGKDEADIAKNYIFFKSPIGKSLIGKKSKDLVSVATPSGERNFEILNVQYV